ncbi:MAG TPA: MoaD/ThiS family protein [Rhodanobacter sp.]|jgi:molybdopterin converting factor small subunit|nr:MoaD/ThiS family protein [Rhodanobacter sp.]
MMQTPHRALKVKVEYYGILREVCAGQAEEIELNERGKVTVADAVAHLVARHPGLGPHRRYMACALDAELVAGDAVLQDGATLALLPPVSGG